jgi:hypothetical protein
VEIKMPVPLPAIYDWYREMPRTMYNAAKVDSDFELPIFFLISLTVFACARHLVTDTGSRLRPRSSRINSRHHTSHITQSGVMDPML